MKQCPRCDRTYADEQLNFCLEDGELLQQVSGGQSSAYDDAPPTVILNEARSTNPVGWQPPAAPPAQWQAQQLLNLPATMSPNQTLAVVSLCLGIGSLTIGWCCSLGVLLSPGALVTGFIALSQIKKDPRQYGGRGLAIGGIVTGTIFIAAYLLIMVIYGAAILFGGLNP